MKEKKVFLLKVCPSCGKSEKQFVGAFCIDCFAKRPLVEVSGKNTQIIACPKCRRTKKESAWVEFTPQLVEELVVRKAKSKFPLSATVKFEEGKNYLYVSAKFRLTADGTEIVQEKHFEIPIAKVLCIDCSRKSGGYKEAIVQIRGDEKRAERVLKKLESAIGGKTFFSSERKKTGGFDLVAGSKAVTLEAVRQLKKPFSMSHKLMGVRNGKKVFLVTILMEV